jgi:hypothetical protein
MLGPTTLTSSKPTPCINNVGKQSHLDVMFLLPRKKNCTSYNTIVQVINKGQIVQKAKHAKIEIHSNNTNVLSIIH